MFAINTEKFEVAAIQRDGFGRPTIYPFADMAVGDSFDAPNDMGFTARKCSRRGNSICYCSRGYAKKYNPTAKFTTRTIDDGATIRCWRVA